MSYHATFVYLISQYFELPLFEVKTPLSHFSFEKELEKTRLLSVVT